jgi:hypothetical protein
MQRGMTRLFQGVLPCLLAVAESLLNLLFSLSLLILWIGIPLGLMFVYFQQTASGVTGLFRRAVSVFQVSWSSSVVMGLLFSCLLAAARLGNATAYTGFAIGALLLTIYLCLVARMRPHSLRWSGRTARALRSPRRATPAWARMPIASLGPRRD